MKENLKIKVNDFDRLDVDESLSGNVEQAFVEALEAAHPFEGRA